MFRFREEATTRLALARDAKGADLPRDGRVWEAIGWVELGEGLAARIGPDPREIRRRVAEKGVFIWP